MINLLKLSGVMQNYKTKLVDSSRMIADIMTADILDNQERFDEMFGLALLDEYPISMRAARITEMCVSRYKHLIKPHINEIVDIIDKSKLEGVRRSFLKILAENPQLLNEELQGRIVDQAFAYIDNQKEAISIRAYSIDIIFSLLKNYPELKNELIYILEAMTRDASVGLRTKSKKILAILKRPYY